MNRERFFIRIFVYFKFELNNKKYFFSKKFKKMFVFQKHFEEKCFLKLFSFFQNKQNLKRYLLKFLNIIDDTFKI